ncbi:chorismate synthase [Helicobacter jaachi]|uniref:Chorismate synthase n=1 Tax=Helicobacter jaachi TaxID=1677920 RepID=A0A4U8TBM5_9HELI|nr:chorismate synthase [Helicobacter jaachi]TLD97309.1 chorismate synthase [Helicobacter jaachi]
MNTFGTAFRVTTFGESHGAGIGCVVDGVPAGLYIDEAFIESNMHRRAPGKNAYATGRKEADKVQILSGVFEGLSTGAPIGMWIANTNTKSSDYTNIKDIFRPGHADFTYFKKYGIRDYRGGGRSSARESAARVAAGSIAQMLLKTFNIRVQSGIYAIGGICADNIDFNYALNSEIYALDAAREEEQKQLIKQAKKAHNSIGGVALICADGLPAGLGEPLYNRLDGALALALMGLNAVKGVEIGDGIESSAQYGSEHNDEMDKKGFKTNHSGGILGGISNGNTLLVKAHFKPTPSIFLPQHTLDTAGKAQICHIKGRHDPCVAVRGSVVAEAMVSLVLADMLLLHSTSQLDFLKRVYECL